MSSLARHPAAAPLLLILTGLLVFGPHAPAAGLHLDDHSYHVWLSREGSPPLWDLFLRYVPGRNLYILYSAALYKLLGPDPRALHLAGLALDIVNALLAYALLRRARASGGLALLVSGLFLVFPNHGETHFWLSAVAMNLLSTALLLLAFLLAAGPRPGTLPRLGGALLLFALALFDYDQVFFMWIPLLFYLRSLKPAAGLTRGAALAFAAACLAMNAAHVLLRVLSPVSEGGRPMIRWSSVPLRFLESVAAGALPLWELPAWDSLWSWAGGPAPTALMLAGLAAAWLLAVRSRWEEPAPGAPRPGSLAAFGALWFFCAFLPNYFWFISPRHHYLPSLGLLIALGAGVSALLARRPAKLLRAGLAAAGALAFGLSAAAGISEGRGWASGARLHRDFQRAAVDLVPEAAGSLFLLGAPHSVDGGPAFAHPQEASWLLAEASGRGPLVGDLTLTPTRTGSFLGNRVDLVGRDLALWAPARRMSVLFHEPGAGFACASTLELSLPDDSPHRVLLSKDPRCRPAPTLQAQVWLSGSRRAKPRGLDLFLASNGAALQGALLRAAPKGFEIELRWRASRPIARDFAWVAGLRDRSGKLLFESVYPDPAAKGRARLLWPAYNDLDRPSRWPEGAGVVESFLFRAPALPDLSRAVLELTLLEEAGDSPWRVLGRFRVTPEAA